MSAGGDALSAEALYARGRFAEAAAQALRELADDANGWRARLVLSAMARDQGDFTGAIGHAQTAWEHAPDNPAAAIALAELLRNRGRADEAAAVLDRTIALCPENADLHNHLGLALRHACRPGQALAAFRQGARLDPANRWAETNMAFGLLRDPDDQAPETFAPLGTAGAAPEIGLGIFCDRFPHTYGFLLQQYTTLLRHFPDARAYSFGRRVFAPYATQQFTDALAQYAETNGDVAARVHPLRPLLVPPSPAEVRSVRLQAEAFRRPRLAYTQFAMNADLFRPLFDSLGIPFAFTLNPGGGFRLDNAYSDDRLRRVFQSPWFRHVIVTYSRTRDYVLDRFGVPPDKVTLIQGTIVLESLLQAHRRPKRRHGVDKPTLDVCFAGLRYSPTGADKGYDRFIAAAHLLAGRFDHLRFHVVGDFDAKVVDVRALGERIVFHGVRDQRWMAGFFSGMDAIVSPNAADQLACGAFDGFPVTTCIEAGMCGVAVFATDPMGLNEALVPDQQVVIVDGEPSRLAEQLAHWLGDPQRLYALAAAGERRFRDHWGESAQMTPRIALLERLLRAEGG
ncbi:MAG TPA: glycosyltransferase [Magnetospirillum sp.]|nr:glycosyltransferase [Magnetospirillum sp.]